MLIQFNSQLEISYLKVKGKKKKKIYANQELQIITAPLNHSYVRVCVNQQNQSIFLDDRFKCQNS